MTTVSEIAYEYSVKTASCPCCACRCGRHGEVRRYILDLDGKEHKVTYSKHYCKACRKIFSLEIPGITVKGSKYSVRYRKKALSLLSSGLTLEQVSRRLKVPMTTLHEWRMEKKRA